MAGAYIGFKVFVLTVIIILTIVKYVTRGNTSRTGEFLDDELYDVNDGKEDWTRKKPPANADGVPLNVDDEYIALDDKDDEIIVDL